MMWRRALLFCLVLVLATFCAAQRQFDCADGDLRLVGGEGVYEGRVEICLSGQWGTICDDLWNSQNAQVVCNQLGFNYSAAIAAGRAHYGSGTGPILLDNVDCDGTEERLFDCVNGGVSIHNCGHHEDAGVFCQPLDQACADGSIRLVGGEIENEGRVEVCYGRQWGTVCDDQWSSVDAAVVCRQLGFLASNAIAVTRALYGQGIGDILYDDVECIGVERNLSDCRNRGLGSHNCQHSEDAGVLCQTTSNTSCHNGDIRLAGGRDSTEGRVEICYNGRWGTVCDDLFGNSDARVICRQLGFTSGAYGQLRASFGQGVGPIFLDNLKCVGNETRLIDCKHDGVGYHNCLHTEDSSVVCIAPDKRCTSGDLRLMEGDFPNEGRVEVCVNNHWGSICDVSFDSQDARVICNQLGFTDDVGEAIPVRAGYFSAGLGMVWLEHLMCGGNESYLLNCSRRKTDYSTCRHTSDVSVICPVSAGSQCDNGAVRLVNGSVQNEGLVEICFNGRWGAVCEDGWGIEDATVLCGQLGFPGNSAIAVGRSFFASSSGPIFLDNVACLGTETELAECFDRDMVGKHDCDENHHAGVICPSSEKTCENGELRLVDGGTLLEGRVEMCYNDRWGTVCDKFWDNLDASVVCKQIAVEYGLESDVLNAVSVTGSAFGRGEGPIFLRDVRCVGSEESLLECSGATVGIYECGNHNQDAGVYCGLQPCSEGALRLSEGLPGTNNTGRVEMCIRNVWTALCDKQFDNRSAQFVCSQLGLPTVDALAVGGDFFGHGHLIPTWSVSYVCESGVCSLQPDHLQAECQHAGVFCEQPFAQCGTGDVRLVGGANSSEGRVEVCINSHWGKICDDSWDNNAATVVCKQLGLPTRGAAAKWRSSFGSSPSLDFMLDDVKCSGNEDRLLECQSSSVLSHNCLHNEEAGVTCHAYVQPCSEGALRLSEGLPGTNNTGRVEMCIRSVWTALCDKQFDNRSAQFVCSQLGLPTVDALAVGGDFFGHDHLIPTWSVSYVCESGVCSLQPDHLQTECQHAGVFCEQPFAQCGTGDVRLVGGANSSEGRVEVCINSHWGKICDDSWDNNAATVVCKQLGLPTRGAAAKWRSSFGSSPSLDFMLDDVKCSGNEDRLLECESNSVLSHNCLHNEEAGVTCVQPCSEGALRLSEGLPGTNNTGRVEMCIRSVWTALCDKQFDDRSAQFVCSQLGLPTVDALAVGGDFFGHDHLIPTWSVSYVCESGVCSLRPDDLQTECQHAGVFCEQPFAQCGTGDVRLVGGANSSEGRVEVCINSHWGKICDDSWDDSAATVVCKQLRLPTLGAAAKWRSSFGSSPSLDFMLDDVKCSGNEDRLLECESNSVLSHNCLDNEEAGVTCHGRVYTPTVTDANEQTISTTNGDTNEGNYSSGQVIAIILPVVVVLIAIVVASVVCTWLALQWRNRSVKQSDQFPIIPGDGIIQFNEFSNEEETEKPHAMEAADL